MGISLSGYAFNKWCISPQCRSNALAPRVSIQSLLMSRRTRATSVFVSVVTRILSTLDTPSELSTDIWDSSSLVDEREMTSASDVFVVSAETRFTSEAAALASAATSTVAKSPAEPIDNRRVSAELAGSAAGVERLLPDGAATNPACGHGTYSTMQG